MKQILQLQIKILILLIFIFNSYKASAQVDIIAGVDVTPPLSIGQTFTYTLEAIAGTTEYQGVQIYLEYNPSVIQLNSLTPDNSVLVVPLSNDTSIAGIIQYSAGSFTPVSGTTIVFTAVFEVIGTSEDVMITHDLEANGNPNGTAAGNSSGQNLTGTTNDIILATLATDNINFNDNISFFPNPVNDVLHINLGINSTEINTITIHTVDGKLITSYKPNTINHTSLKVDTSALHPAIYFISIVSIKNETATFKFLVKR